MRGLARRGRTFRERVFGEVDGPLPDVEVALGKATRKWRTWKAQRRPLPVARLAHQPEARSLNILIAADA
jgi:hypothetical protein